MTGHLGKALEFAERKHAGQVRKGTTISYISHPLAVTALVLEYGGTEAEACAAALHDVVEDCGGIEVFPEIEREFGSEVAGMVLALSDSLTRKGVEKAPWKERKEAYLEHLASAPASVKLVSAADKLHNAESIVKDHQEVGEAVWERFKGGKAGTLWYYGEVAKILRETPLGFKLSLVVEELLRR